MAASFWLRKFQYPDSSPRVEKACGAVAKKPERVEKVSLQPFFELAEGFSRVLQGKE